MKFLDNSRTEAATAATHRLTNVFLRRAWTGQFTRRPRSHLDKINDVQPAKDQERRATVRPAAFGERGGNVALDAVVHWLLTSDERGNPATAIDAEHGDGRA